MRAWSVCVILLVPLFLFSGEGPVKPIETGLMRFSRLVFDEEKSLMGEPLKNLEKILIHRFKIKHYFENEEISFAEMEDPSNIIDKAMTRDTIKKLEEFCLEKKLDGIIFGHIQQEKKMVFMFRFYSSQKLANSRKIYGANRIQSFTKEIKLKKLTPQRVKQVTDRLIEQLGLKIYGKNPEILRPKNKTTGPVVQLKKKEKTKKAPSVVVLKQEPSSPLEPVFAAQLEFSNAAPHSPPGLPAHVKMINEAVANAINVELTEIQERWKKKLLVNQNGHKIPPTTQNVKELVEIIYDVSMPGKDKIKKIIDSKMIPHKVDMIITGQYIFNPDHPLITIRPIVIIKSSRKMLIKNLQFKINELICSDSKGEPMLCKGASQQITAKVRAFLKLIYE